MIQFKFATNSLFNFIILLILYYMNLTLSGFIPVLAEITGIADSTDINPKPEDAPRIEIITGLLENNHCRYNLNFKSQS